MSNQPYGPCDRCRTFGFWNCAKHNSDAAARSREVKVKKALKVLPKTTRKFVGMVLNAAAKTEAEFIKANEPFNRIAFICHQMNGGCSKIAYKMGCSESTVRRKLANRTPENAKWCKEAYKAYYGK